MDTSAGKDCAPACCDDIRLESGALPLLFLFNHLFPGFVNDFPEASRRRKVLRRAETEKELPRGILN